MPQLRSYDDVFAPAIEKIFTGCQALSKTLSDCGLPRTAEWRDKAANAAIAAYEAKQIFDREFKDKQVDDPARPGRTMLMIDDDNSMRALRLIHRNLQQAFTLAMEVKEAAYSREYAQDPELCPYIPVIDSMESAESIGGQIAERIQREISMTPEERREVEKAREELQRRNDVMREAQEEMPEHKIIKAIDDASFMGIAADANALLSVFIAATESKGKPASRA